MKNIFLIESDGLALKFLLKIYLFYKKIKNLKYILILLKTSNSIRNFKNISKERNAIIIANGPSVNNLDYKKLNKIKDIKNIDIFCLNNYLNTELAEYLLPNYYVLADPTYFKVYEDWQKQFTNINISEEKILLKIKEKKIKTFIPVNFRNYIGNTENFIYFNSYCHPSINNMKNPIFPLGCFPLSAMYTLTIAIYMGYKTISIIGFDHSNFKNIIIDESNKLSEGLEYFNNKDNITIKYPSHVYKNISEYLYEYSLIFKIYNKYSNFEIYNLNNDGYIDAFEKKDIFEILK